MNALAWSVEDKGAPQDIPATPLFGLVICGAWNLTDDRVCTRPEGHGGRHVASGPSRTLAVWP